MRISAKRQMQEGRKNAKKCWTCAYAQGWVKTLIEPCSRCTGKTSIFPEMPLYPKMIEK